MGVKTLLNVGCGPEGAPLPREFAAYKEVRLDADKEVLPDIQASITAMPMVQDESFDGVYASHVLEHLYFHEVGMALEEVHRVLKEGGKFVVQVPDLQSIGSMIALDKPDHVAYVGGIGPVAPLDMLYGHRGQVAQGKRHMAHKTGFTASLLEKLLKRAGFGSVVTNRDMKFDLKVTAFKEEIQLEKRPVDNGAAENTAKTHQLCARTVEKEEVADASQEPGAESLPEHEIRACVGEEASLR